MAETQFPGLREHRAPGTSLPYYNALAAAALVNPISTLNTIPVLPAGAVIIINGQVYVTRDPIYSGKLGGMFPLIPRATYIGPKKVGDTFVDRAAVYWNSSNNYFTSSAGGNTLVGYAVSNEDLGTATNGTAASLSTASLTALGPATVTGGTSADGLVGGYASADTYMEVEVIQSTTVTASYSSPLSNAIADPGTGVAIPVTATGSCQLVLAGVGETNTIAAPTFEGQNLLINAKTVAASATRIVTVADPHFDGTNNTITFSAVAQFIKLVAVSSGTGFVWQMECYRGCALSHV